jgi:FtsP/CotA-like multicopper oxidase with cupredoxin domain
MAVRDRTKTVHRLGRVVTSVALVTAASTVPSATSAGADPPSTDPYAVTRAVDADPSPTVFETTLTAQPATRDIGNGVTANVWTYNGTVPGPEIRVKVGDTVVVHFRNQLPSPTGIHWHGIELANQSDGSALTQNEVPPGGEYLYRFRTHRPGIFWYHPHHRPTNQVFRGLYGSFIVEDPHNETLVTAGVLPPRSSTRTLVLSDATVCKDPGTNDTDTYDDSLPWSRGPTLPEQAGPFPSDLCDRPMDDHGSPVRDAQGRPLPLHKGDIPNIVKTPIPQLGGSSRTNEGQTVLANGTNAGHRNGSPEAPGPLAAGAALIDVAAGQGLRFQAVNAATTRYFRLRLTDAAGTLVPLLRVGGQGGLLDKARQEGGIVGPVPGSPVGFDTKYAKGELLLSPSDRADFVAAFPLGTPVGTATLWTLDFDRAGNGTTYLPTVPVLHVDVTAPAGPAYTISEGDPLRTHPAVNDPVEALGPQGPLPDTTGSISPFRDPATFNPPKPGATQGLLRPREEIRYTSVTGPGLSIDNVRGAHDDSGGDYRATPHSQSTRYARVGDLLELKVNNTAAAHHTFHLHGFSFQPLTLESLGAPTYTFDHHEFVDTIDIPSHYTLKFRVRLDDRPLVDGTTPGGAMGRWVFHCHILFHAAFGMIAELVVVAPDGNERPYVDADAVSVSVDEGGTATTTGTFADPDRDPVTLSASEGTVTDTGGGRWSWSSGGPPRSRTVYVTATDGDGHRGQVAFEVDVVNVAPTVTVTSPASGTGHAVGTTVTVTASITDPGGPGGLACRFDWDDGLGAGAPVAPVDGVCRDSRTLLSAGVRTVTVTGSDGAGATGSDSTLVAVYDADAGFVTGSGTVGTTGSPPAAFDVAAKYHKLGAVPVGHVVVGSFASTAMEWLVVAGNRAQVRGTGTIGGTGSYTFLLTVADGSPDRLRLKVWDASGAVVSDKAPGHPDDIDTADPPPIGTGSIVVHH